MCSKAPKVAVRAERGRKRNAKKPLGALITSSHLPKDIIDYHTCLPLAISICILYKVKLEVEITSVDNGILQSS